MKLGNLEVRVRRACVALAGIIILGPCAFAQSNYTRQEVELSATYLRTEQYADFHMAGFSGRYTLNLNPSLAIESAFTFYPRSTMTIAGQGGREMTWFTGVKAGIRRQRWGLYGKAQPGVRIFTNADNQNPRIFDTAVRRHFALDLGGVVEFYPAGRWIVRADVSEILTRFGDNQVRPILLPGPVLLVYPYDPGRVQSAISASIGLTYRLGELRRARPAGTEASFRRIEGGVQYALANVSVDQGTEMSDSSGLGVWASLYLNRHIALDGAVTHFWNGSRYVSAQQGGNFWQAVVGAKVGITREKFGAYAKVRPGMARFAKAITNTPKFLVTNQFDPATQFAIDMGGVVEFYPTRHVVARADFGDLTIHYGARNAVGLFAGPYRAPAYTESAIQTSFGIGWRF